MRIAVSAAAVGIILRRIPLPALWAAFEGMDAAWLWAALVAVLVMLAARWVRWHGLLYQSRVLVARCDSARSLLGGFALSVVMPGRVGELGRFLFLPKSKRASALLMNIVDRSLDIWALATFLMASLFVILPRPAAIFAAAVWLALLPLAIGLPSLVSKLGGLP